MTLSEESKTTLIVLIDIKGKWASKELRLTLGTTGDTMGTIVLKGVTGLDILEGKREDPNPEEVATTLIINRYTMVTLALKTDPFILDIQQF